MIEVSLDNITVQYLIDSGRANDRPSGRQYLPGGRSHNDAEAMRAAVDDLLGIHTYYKTHYLECTGLTFHSDRSLDARTLRKLLRTRITYKDQQYRFDYINSGSSSYRNFGDLDDGEIRDWMEVHFSVVE